MRNTYFTTADKATCYGCGMCEAKCPVHAIKILPDEHGFYYPTFYENVCINCGICENVCPYHTHIGKDIESSENGNIYQAAHKKDEILLRSQCGGIFTALSDLILSENGAVYGAVIEADFSVRHIRTQNTDDRDRMCRSKYVQSRIEADLMYSLENDLKSGTKVIFTGTPCQCAAVAKNFGDYENLLVVDFICHGVPSPMVWRKYVDYMQAIIQEPIQSVVFRNKFCEMKGSHCESFYGSSDKEYITDDYAALFYSHLAHRESCFKCQFAQRKRYSDITIGGFLEFSDFQSKYDSSMIIVNTDKGSEAFDLIKDQIRYTKSNLAFFHNQPCLYHPVEEPTKYEEFWEAFKNEPFKSIVSRYATKELKEKFRIKLAKDCKHVSIVNAHWSNRGDEAALRPIINDIFKKNPDTYVTVAFKDRQEVKQFPYWGRIRHFSAQFLPDDLKDIYSCIECDGQSKFENMKQIYDEIKKSDLVIYSPGGAVISDTFWWRKQLEYFFPIICANELNVPVIIAAPSIGPFNGDEEHNSLRKKWLNAVEEIIVREKISAGYLKSIGVKDNVVATIDTAFYDNPDTVVNEKQFLLDSGLHSFFKTYKKIVGITLSDFSWHVSLSKTAKLKDLGGGYWIL